MKRQGSIINDLQPLVVPRLRRPLPPLRDRPRRDPPLPSRWNLTIEQEFLLRHKKQEIKMGRGLLLWLIGIPIPIILLIWLFGGLS
jgi:hypothetical protein